MDPESRLKCFLHFGNEERMYIPDGNLRYHFKPDMIKAIELLLQDEERALKIVPTILKVHQCHTSIEPYALLYALAMVVRKARINMNKNPLPIPEKEKEKEKESQPGPADMEVESKPTDEKKDDAESEKKDETESEKKKFEPKKWDLVIRDAYKAARKISDDKGDYLLIFTYYLREIAKTEGKKGFGRGWRKTIEKWYGYPEVVTLAKTVTKFNINIGWTHANLLALCGWKHSQDKARDAVLLFARYDFNKASAKYEKDDDARVKNIMKYLKLIRDLRRAPNVEHALEFVACPEITMEYVPPVFLKSHSIWLHLIPKMSPEQLLSIINRLSRLKMFKHAEIVTKVVAKFEELNQPSIHPIHVYISRRRYEEGPNLAVEFQYIQRRRTIEESAENANNENAAAVNVEPEQVQRQPPPRRNPEIINCLNNVFNKTISSLAPTGRCFLIGLDAQAATASRRCLFERFISIEEAALLVSLCVIKAETGSVVKLVTFTKDSNTGTALREIPVCRVEETMESLKAKINRDNCVTGNVGELIRYAKEKKEHYDMFIALSDNLVAPGDAYEELKTYQKEVNPKAKVVTCCFIGRHKKYKDLTKPDMLLICGFDKHVGMIIQAYSRDAF